MPSSQPSSMPSSQPSSQPSTMPTRHPSSQPSSMPSSQPSSHPSTAPSSQPSSEPTLVPSSQPSSVPSSQPSSQPSTVPSSQPSSVPSSQPSSQPSTVPSSQPSSVPSSQPSSQPSTVPSGQPSSMPSSQPSSQPSTVPSSQPSSIPSSQPSSQPSTVPSSQPSSMPSIQPSSQPSTVPSSQPSSVPSIQPSSQPSTVPSSQPSSMPSSQPSSQPSTAPSSQPSSIPSIQPSSQPSTVPSGQPSSMPSSQPSSQPSTVPSGQPSSMPSSQPSSQPSTRPSSQPSSVPSSQPSSQPSTRPSSQPSRQPSSVPSSQPSSQPSTVPSGQPSRQPSSQPSSQPSTRPSSQPSRQPSSQPSTLPSSQPSSVPSSQPSSQPSTVPSSQPSSVPSSQPSSHPSTVPSGQPSRQPSIQPSSQPSTVPSSQPSSVPSSQPSSEPSTVPSGQPSSGPSTPTSLPTNFVTPSIPKIVLIEAFPSSHNVSLAVHLSTITDSSGAVFCIALSKGVVPPSIGEVRSRGTSQQYTTSTKPVTVFISGLLALRSYQAYCYVQVSDGSGTPHSDVINKHRAFNTTCCQEVLFFNAPASVYGDASMYSGISDLSTYVFSYYLESAPTQGSIVVTPTITLENGGTNNQSVTIVPSSAEYLSTYTLSRLKGQFYITAASTVSGDFVVSLEISGQDRFKFTTARTRVNIMSISQPLSAPFIESCKFDKSGGYVIVNFDKPTDQAGITADTWPCGQLLEFNRFNETMCSWTSLSTIKIVFTSLTASSLKPSDTMSVKGGMLRAACQAGVNCNNNIVLKSYQVDKKVVEKGSMKYMPLTSSLSVIVQGPTNPVAPLIVVIVPIRIGACNDIMIDLSASSGNGGRPWSSVVWTVLAQNGNTTALTGFLGNNFDSLLNYVIVPRHMLISTTYSIGATVTNFLGDAASSASIVKVTGDSNLPVVSILGPVARTIKSSDVVSLQGSGIPSKCGSSHSLNYTWTLTNSSGVLMTSKSTSTDPRVYIAPAYSFIAGSSYTITLTVKSFSTKGQLLSSGYTLTNIYVAHGDVKAAVRGGYTRDMAVNRELTLDASISSDENTVTGSKGLLFSWRCTIASLTNFGSNCNFGSLNTAAMSTSILSLPAYEMVVSTKYLFTVTVTSVDERSASQNVLITALLPGSPFVYSDNTLSKFNRDSLVVVKGSITSNVSIVAIWTAYYSGLSVPLDRAYTRIVRDFTAKDASATIAYPLAVMPNTFVAGRTYTFRLSARPTLSNTFVAITEVVLTVNSPPIGGHTVVSPRKGKGLSTDFAMSTSGWSDDLGDYPLSYSFSYQLAVSDLTPALTIAVLSPLSYAVSLLPPGLSGGMFVIAMYLHRCSQYNFHPSVFDFSLFYRSYFQVLEMLVMSPLLGLLRTSTVLQDKRHSL